MIPWALALLPAVVLVAFVDRHGVDVPLVDQWQLVPLLVRWQDGTLSAGDLWAQHNEHRILVPRLVMLLLADLTGWNVRAELFVSLLLAGLVWALLAWQSRESARLLGRPAPPWLPALLSLLVFSLTQWENWLWGWQLTIFLNIVAVVAGLATLATPRLGWPRFAVAAALGLVATLSFGSGFVYWPAAALLLALDGVEDQVGRRLRLACWGAALLVLTGLYLHGYQAVDRGATSGLHPLDLGLFALGVLGAPVSPYACLPRDLLAAPWPPLPAAILAGLLGVGAVAYVSHRLLRGAPAELRRTLALWPALGLYAAGAALLVAVGRGRFAPLEYGLASRYTTLSTLLWCSLAVQLALLAGDATLARRVRALSLGLALASGASTVIGHGMGAPWKLGHLDGRARLLAGDPSAYVRLAEPYPEAPAWAAELRRRRLSSFRD